MLLVCGNHAIISRVLRAKFPPCRMAGEEETSWNVATGKEGNSPKSASKRSRQRAAQAEKRALEAKTE